MANAGSWVPLLELQLVVKADLPVTLGGAS